TSYDGAGGRWSADAGASIGDPGAPGAAGIGGSPAIVYGTLSASGWEPSAGGDGQAGDPGQGSGGGGQVYTGFQRIWLSIGGNAGGGGGGRGEGGQSRGAQHPPRHIE